MTREEQKAVEEIYRAIKKNRDDMKSSMPTLHGKRTVDTAAGFITAYEVIMNFIEERYPGIQIFTKEEEDET